MGGSRGWCALAALSLVCCSSPEQRDLAKNEQLLPPLHYRSRQPADRAAFVTPMADARQAWVADAADTAFPVTAMPEGVWERSLCDMLDDVLRRELTDSGIVSGLLQHAEPKSLVIKPSLVTGAAGVQERPNGRRTLAEVRIRLVVYGPDEGNGKRAIVHDQTYGQRQESDIDMSPVRAPTLLARATRGALGQALAGLDQSNVARAGVPLDVPDTAPEKSPEKPPEKGR